MSNFYHQIPFGGVNTETGTIALHFGKPAFTGRQPQNETATGVLAFSKIHFVTSALAENLGSVVLTFHKPTITATGWGLGAPGGGPRFFWTF